MFSKTKADYDILFKDVINGNGRVYHTSSVFMRKEYCFNRPTFFSVAKGYGDYPLAVCLTLNSKIRYIAKTMSLYRYMSTPTSWSTKTVKTRDSVIALHQNNIDFLTNVLEYTNADQEQYVKKAIALHKYSIEIECQKYKTAITNYPDCFKNESAKRKVYLFSKAYIPWLGNIIDKLKK